jgi:hypothetical protein
MSQAVPEHSTPTVPTPPIAPARATGASDVRLLVTRLTVVLNRRRAYDAAHPMVRQAEEALLDTLRTVLGGGRTLTLGVAHRELLVDGAPFPQGAAAGRELAERLHRRSVGGVTLHGSVTIDGLRTAIGWLALDPSAPLAGLAAAPSGDRRGRSAGLEEPPEVPGFSIARVPYDRLALQQHAAEQQRGLQNIWRSLAEAALLQVAMSDRRADADGPDADSTDADSTDAGSADDAASATSGPDGADRSGRAMDALAEPAGDDVPAEALADAIEVAIKDRSRAREVGYVLQRMALELREVPPEVRSAVAERLRDLLLRLRQSSLAAIVDALGDDETRHRFMTSLVDVLPASAVVDWLERTASLTEQQISHHLLRVLAKLSSLASDQQPGARVSRDFRDAARRLVDEWTLADPNPSEHDALLDYIAIETLAPAEGRRSPIAVPEAPSDLPPAHLDALRLVQMACELDVVGEDTVVAARRLVDEGQHRLLLDVLAAAPGTRAPAALGDTVVSASALRRVLLATPFDAAEAKLLLSHARVAHAPVLLDALAEATQRSARRVLLSTLRDFGPELLPLLVRQLDPGAAWYYLRNVLVLLRDLLAESGPDAPERLRAPLYLSFLDHPQAQVRAEALRLVLDLPTSRSIGLLRAIDDQSNRVAAIAIDALIAFAGDESLATSVRSESEAFAQRLALLVDEHRFEPELLGRAVRAMQIDASASTREWLLGHVTRRSRFLRRLRLTEGRPSVLAALRVLTLVHAGDAQVDDVLAQVDKCESGDLRRTTVERARDERAAADRPAGPARSAPASPTPAGAAA